MRRDIDYNPNKPDIVVTSGDDGRVKFWDLRHASRPIKTVRAHTHWACCARYNPFHDQIILR